MSDTSTITSETFEERVARLQKRTSVAGWKGAGSVAVAPSTWDVALRLVRSVAAQGSASRMREPFISADGDGSLCIRWSAELGGAKVEVEVRPDGSVACDDDRESGILEVNADTNAIASSVRKLFAA